MRVSRISMILVCALLSLPMSCVANDALQRANTAYESQDFSEAAALFRPLAEEGNSDAQLRLGILYQFGRGVEQDYSTAMKWYQEADRQGNNKARDRIAALEKQINAKAIRDSQVANSPLPEANFGGALLNLSNAYLQAQGQVPVTASSSSGGGASSGEGIPGGNFSSWSQADQQQAAAALKVKCQSQCSSYMSACKTQFGAQRACYEAGACVKACVVNNMPSDWPNRESMRQSALADYSNAQRLGSNAPVFIQ